MNTSNDRAHIEAAIGHYFQGHATGDAAHFHKAFLPSARVEGVRQDGAFASWDMPTYCALFKGQPAPDEAKRSRTIESIEIFGNAALARATLVHGVVTFTDLFILSKVDGAWKIVTKGYSGVWA
jgi:Putative lumazine-binding